MRTDQDLIHLLSEAFSHAVNAAVDARMTAIAQAHANAIGQLSADIAGLKVTRVDDSDRINSLLMDVDLLKQRLAAMDVRIPVEGMSEMRVKTMIDSALETAFRQHGEEYDHDSFESAAEEVESVDFSTLMNEDNIEEAVRRLFRNASLSVDF